MQKHCLAKVVQLQKKKNNPERGGGRVAEGLVLFLFFCLQEIISMDVE